MKTKEIIKALRRIKVETGSLACLGCGYEHNCDIHGCRAIRDAADEIEKLADRCARYAEEIAVLQEKTRWIPVTERLPEDRSNVLVAAYWYERWGVYMGWCVPERAEWSVHIGIGDRNDVAVTHWLPLPEPPEGEKTLEGKVNV